SNALAVLATNTPILPRLPPSHFFILTSTTCCSSRPNTRRHVPCDTVNDSELPDHLLTAPCRGVIQAKQSDASIYTEMSGSGSIRGGLRSCQNFTAIRPELALCQ